MMLLALLLGCGGPCESEWVLVGPTDASTCAAVAKGGPALKKGLQGAPRLKPGEGLLLQYPVPSKACVHMKGMDQPIDALFVDGIGRILHSECGIEPGDPLHCTAGTQAVLERAPDPACGSWTFLREAAASPSLTETWVPPMSLAGPLCKSSDGEAQVAGHLTLEIHVDESVSDATVQQLLGGAQAWWGPQGLDLEVTSPPSRRPIGPLLSGVRLDWMKRLKDAGLPESGATPEQQVQIDSILDDVVLSSYRELLANLSVTPKETTAAIAKETTVVVVIVPHIAAPGSLGEALFEELRGLSVSPWLPASEGRRRLYDRLALPNAFTAVVVVGVEPVSHLGPDAVDLTLAHELGHALGLPHVEDPNDLMRDGVHQCVPTLKPDQGAALRGYRRR